MSTNALTLLDNTIPVGNLDAYIRWAYDLPMLTDEEEKTYAKQWFEDQDVEAARRLTVAHMRFVIKVARGYLGYGLPLADLIQEGGIGLMKAVKRFDPNVGVRLVTFAVHWIKAEIHEYVIRNWRIVKIATTKAQRKLFFNLRKSKKRLGWCTHEEVQTVAEALGVTPKDVMHMESRMNSYDLAFDNSDSDDDRRGANFSPSQYLEDKTQNPATLIETSDTAERNQGNLFASLQQLDERSRDIVQQRWLADKKATLHDLAAKYEVSAERIRQLEQNAFKKLKVAIEAES